MRNILQHILVLLSRNILHRKFFLHLFIISKGIDVEVGTLVDTVIDRFNCLIDLPIKRSAFIISVILILLSCLLFFCIIPEPVFTLSLPGYSNQDSHILQLIHDIFRCRCRALRYILNIGRRNHGINIRILIDLQNGIYCWSAIISAFT